ncbi:peptidoglycan DD-metalloendopeptidase family protein [Streptomyces sp. ISL-1]|uniref:M23 family metallopeptidase n=1 Tax=Streptomyces sp. ISL-1 TaxID=2817657 RepID=UPI001BEB23BA|nr:peptidoglycan DD-metalloendopeptidase family protein [Streptomyces sp. ISL-1]MBT2390186.1 peptidoglycan DD-metalloendopeptidase family protein [Streptomyces sp. ISL-1]
MRLRHRDRLPLVPVVLCALLGPSAPGAVASDGPQASTSAEVVQLFDDAAKATETYEQGRRTAEVQREKAGRLQRQLNALQDELDTIREEVGSVARAQYRTGGTLALTAQLLLSRNPDELLRGRRLAWQAELAVDQLLGRAAKASRRVSLAEGKAQAARRELDAREERLATIKRSIEAKLESAQWKLQGEADRSVAAGTCSGAVQLGRSGGKPPRGVAWVAPVEHYGLSAGFNSSGQRWAKRHTGQDFAVGIGTPVRAIGAGRVISVSCGGGFGIEVVVQHPGGYFSQYAHLAAVTVDQGDQVRTGQWIAQTGTTGNSTGPHLHFEVRLTPYLGSGVDPVNWLREHGVWL